MAGNAKGHDRMAAAARAALGRGDPDEALHLAERVIAERPRHAAALAVAGTARILRGRMDDGLAALRTAARIARGDPTIQCDLAAGHVGLGDYDAATAAYQAALRADRRHEPALVGLAEIHERRGEGDAALRLLDRADRAAGGAPSPRATSLRATVLAAGDEAAQAEAARLATGLAEDDAAPWPHRRAMLFLLGRAADRRGEASEAVAWLTRANALGRVPLDRRAAAEHRTTIRRVFDAARHAGRPTAAVPTRGPLFIVGLPRSGSTLLESMLAAHPRIHAGGELVHLAAVLTRASEIAGVPYPDAWSRLAAANLDRLAASYLDRLRRSAGGKAVDPADLVVDKSLDNVRHLGAIDRLLPEAVIVHVHRHRVDAGLAAWMQNLMPTLHPWAGDLADCGWHVREIEAHVAHWRTVLGDRLLSVAYEDLVADPEGQLRRVLEHAGLPWDPACLRSHDRRRDVATASYAQVAEPVHQRTVGRRDRYRDFIGPLIEALGPDPGTEGAAAAD